MLVQVAQFCFVSFAAVVAAQDALTTEQLKPLTSFRQQHRRTVCLQLFLVQPYEDSQRHSSGGGWVESFSCAKENNARGAVHLLQPCSFVHSFVHRQSMNITSVFEHVHEHPGDSVRRLLCKTSMCTQGVQMSRSELSGPAGQLEPNSCVRAAHYWFMCPCTQSEWGKWQRLVLF